MMEYDEEGILALNIKPTFEEFLEFLSIERNGLAAQLFEPVYRQFFVHSKDLKEEYNKYYSIEYSTFSDYLDLCHNTELSEEELEKEYVYKFKNNYQLTDSAYDTDYLERFITLIKKMEEENEN